MSEPGKYPIDHPCSVCSAGDTKMEYHDHEPPFRKGYGPAEPEVGLNTERSQCPRCEGTKLYNGRPCAICDGTGWISEEQLLSQDKDCGSCGKTGSECHAYDCPEAQE